MSKPTPGPWLREGTTVYALDGHIVDGRQIFRNGEPQKVNRFYCHVVYQKVGGGTELEADANARLISAAPELQEACKAVMKYFGKGEAGDWLCTIAEDPSTISECIRKARAAIAKAEGAQ